MRKYLLVVVVISIVVLLFYPWQAASAQTQQGIWQFQSVDTMKYSRDLARQELHNPDFDNVIDQQMQNIENTGATYVAIATPYDNEFLPILRRWVASARAHHLHVWFRGNFSGWEGWFGYAKITRVQHMKMTKAFILHNADLFQDGDIFTACPECENGGPGDPRQTGDISGFQTFLIQEYTITHTAFSEINKHVASNYDSMNGDVARVVMDKQTTEALGGIVTIDHYVKDSEQMVRDIKEIAANSGGKIVIGEFGAPIPNIQGTMTDTDQANWLGDILYKLAHTKEVIGVNYWTSVGGSTALWDANGQAKQAVNALTNAYSFHGVSGTVIDALHHPIKGVKVVVAGKTIVTDSAGHFLLPYLTGKQKVAISTPGYFTKAVVVTNDSKEQTITLEQKKENIFFMLERMLGL